MNCQVYIACKMTGRDKQDMIYRSTFVCGVLKNHGLVPRSPVIEEHVKNNPGPLVNNNTKRLRDFWTQDKKMIRRECHVVLIDGAQNKSYGVEREYALNRWCLWKPTVLVVDKHYLSVADFEDDYITDSITEAAEYIRINFGTWPKRTLWRIKMLWRCLPGWILDQLYAWR